MSELFLSISEQLLYTMSMVSGLCLLVTGLGLTTGAVINTSAGACSNLRIDSEWGVGMSADLDVTSDHDGSGIILASDWLTQNNIDL